MLKSIYAFLPTLADSRGSLLPLRTLLIVGDSTTGVSLRN